MYNRDQWIESFEGQLSLLRPHLTGRILAAMSTAAWHKHGRKDEDPIQAAKAWSATLGVPASAAPARRSQRGFAALMLAMLVLMLALVPAMLLMQSAMDRERVLNAQVKAMLKGSQVPPRNAPRNPAAPASAPS